MYRLIFGCARLSVLVVYASILSSLFSISIIASPSPSPDPSQNQPLYPNDPANRAAIAGVRKTTWTAHGGVEMTFVINEYKDSQLVRQNGCLYQSSTAPRRGNVEISCYDLLNYPTQTGLLGLDAFDAIAANVAEIVRYEERGRYRWVKETFTVELEEIFIANYILRFDSASVLSSPIVLFEGDWRCVTVDDPNSNSRVSGSGGEIEHCIWPREATASTEIRPYRWRDGLPRD